MLRHPDLLDRSHSVLVVVDMQESLLNVIHGRESLLASVRLLCQAAVILDIPLLATTQYAEKLGGIAPEVADAMGGALENSLDKLSFSCAGLETFIQRLAALNRRQVVLCGMETHICVTQTAYDLLHLGYSVHVAADAVSSRSFEKHKLGMERLRDAGVRPCAAEAAVYEWLVAAGSPEFKQILRLVKFS